MSQEGEVWCSCTWKLHTVMFYTKKKKHVKLSNYYITESLMLKKIVSPILSDLLPHRLPLSSFAPSGVKMYRTTRSPMMQPLVNSGMGMAPFFKVNTHLFVYELFDSKLVI